MIFTKIKELCAESGISIARLEKECRIGNGTISAWDKSSPRLNNLKKIADFFGKPIEYFLQ